MPRLGAVLHRKLWPSTWDKKVSAFPLSSHSDPGEGAFSRLDYGSLALRPVALLALLSELTRLASSHRGRLHPGFRRFGHPPRRRISLQCQLGNLHWQDFHLLDHQLASLHYPKTLGDPARRAASSASGFFNRRWAICSLAIHCQRVNLVAL